MGGKDFRRKMHRRRTSTTISPESDELGMSSSTIIISFMVVVVAFCKMVILALYIMRLLKNRSRKRPVNKRNSCKPVPCNGTANDQGNDITGSSTSPCRLAVNVSPQRTQENLRPVTTRIRDNNIDLFLIFTPRSENNQPLLTYTVPSHTAKTKWNIVRRLRHKLSNPEMSQTAFTVQGTSSVNNVREYDYISTFTNQGLPSVVGYGCIGPYKQTIENEYVNVMTNRMNTSPTKAQSLAPPSYSMEAKF
ncbi:hypothetical protein LOTGIDRAFT_160918 [Lottia gigantea]|uniref:Uncharacterized protein n=1 Tax=Lottia gigantea TaxID=225164 RepID=V3ZUI9_LOTGI|nr:hypothetical protein LOTGIDRAFT_160918 [Lottia gigantea]ESO95153.1 hypothetical protein LOTGIDRAFT_160918 [Lottia gigantea]